MDICQHSRGMIRPGFASIITFETKKAQGAPDAQSHPRLACKRKRHRYAETPALPAQWLTAYTWFPRCPGLLVLLDHKFRRWLGDIGRMQHWHRCRVGAIATANKR